MIWDLAKSAVYGRSLCRKVENCHLARGVRALKEAGSNEVDQNHLASIDF
jgi:hypothetical protein